MDLEAAEAAAGTMLAALGLPVDSDDMLETPRRLVAAYAEMLTVPDFDLTTFANSAGYDELVLVQDIPVRSLCEHHLLPFVGVAHVGYLPDDRILGLSKFARLVDFFARRAQTQERLTTQIADHLQERLAPVGRRRGDRGRALVHVVARGPCGGCAYRDIDAARRPA